GCPRRTPPRPTARDRSGSPPARPCRRACPCPLLRCSPAAPVRPGLLAPHRTWRPGRRGRLRQPGRPLRRAPTSSASPAQRPRQQVATLLDRFLETRNARGTPACGGWDLRRVDEGPVRGGVREVPDAVDAHALGELEGGLLLRGAPLVAHEPRWLQVFTRAEGLLERRAARVQRRAVRDRIDGELARRGRVRELAGAVVAT